MENTPNNPDVPVVDRIAALERSLVMVNARLDDGEMVMDGIKADLQQNTAATKRIETNTSDMVEFLGAMKGAFKVFNWIGKLAKPMGAIIGLGVAIAGAWQLYRTGVPPK